MTMAEAAIGFSEAYTPEQSLYRLTAGVGNSRISEALALFQKEDMKGPEAARQLFSLFEAFSINDPSGLLNPDTNEPKTLWDQVGWACANPRALTQAQRDTLIPLKYFALEALAHMPLPHEIHGVERDLSPDVRKKAEKVFTAYDAAVAKVFDPDLPEWRVSGKAAMGFVAIATALAACGPVVTPKPTETLASPTAVATETYTPTATQTQILETPTATLIPSETKVPVPEYFKGIAPDLESFTMVTEDQEKLILADIMAHPQLTEPTTNHIRLDADVRSTYAAEAIGCYYGENCVVRASIRENNPFGGPDLWKLIFEFRGNDGSHRFMTMYIGGIYSNNIEIQAWKNLNSLQGIETGQHLNIDIFSRLDTKESETNPYTWAITNGASKEDQTVLQGLEKNQMSFPDGVETITVQLDILDQTT